MPRSTVEFTLNRTGVREVLTGPEVRALVDEAAAQVAGRVRAAHPGLDPSTVEVTAYTTDRQGAAVTVTDPASMAWQARDGLLTRAAAALGAEVKVRGG